MVPLPTASGLMRTNTGFTLIELLIVVVIIGILAMIAIPQYANTKEKAYIAAMKTDLRNLASAQEAYWSMAESEPRARQTGCWGSTARTRL